jgi:hypothetical protein
VLRRLYDLKFIDADAIADYCTYKFFMRLVVCHFTRCLERVGQDCLTHDDTETPVALARKVTADEFQAPETPLDKAALTNSTCFEAHIEYQLLI